VAVKQYQVGGSALRDKNASEQQGCSRKPADLSLQGSGIV
jgi:hypothetical protein